MNKKTIIIIISLAAILVLANALVLYYFVIKKSNTEQVVKKTETYICPMHPQIQQDHPGVCPICNMELVLKGSGQTMDDKESSKKDKELGEITLSPTEQVVANVKTDIVKYEDFGSGIEANGVVKQRDDAVRQISSPVKGKITKLYITYEGQKVTQGQKAFEIYSPELIATQREFLLASDNYKNNSSTAYEGIRDNLGSILSAARQRLKLWFMSDAQIDELAESHNIRNSITYFSDYSGVVTKKYFNEGSWVMEGTTIADVVNLSSVWITANIYEYELNQVRTGQSAEIILSGYEGNNYFGKIDYINPFVNPDTRSVEVRITASNAGLKLKPEMFVKVKISTSNVSDAIVVPKTAVLRTGKMDMVYIKKSGNTFVARDVKIGGERNGKYMITSGIDVGEEIVVSAGFLIDSESQIRMGSGSSMEGMDMPVKKNDMEIKNNDAMKDMKK